MVIDGSKYEGGDGVFINHSCDPNAEYTQDPYQWTRGTGASGDIHTLLQIKAIR